MSITTVWTGRRVGLALALLAGLGCGAGGRSDPRRYIPPSDKARDGIEAMLTAWKEGDPVASPGAYQINVVDSLRRPGQRLKDFEVLGEVFAEDGPRRFTVRLSLESPSEELKLRYCAIGIDPLWVIREDEMEMITHWDCMDPLPGAEKATAAAGTSSRRP